MSLEPIRQELLESQYHIFMAGLYADEAQSAVALRLARFAEAHVINEGNRQIEALKPRQPILLPPYDLDEADARQVRLKMRSALFDYFLWFCSPETGGALVATLADEALLDVERRLASHQQKEKTDG